LQLLAFIFFGVVFIQVIYFIVFIVAFKKKNATKDSSSPPVSILVCAHDEEENLRQLIPMLLQQNYGEFEVIVINDRSNDNTYDYLLEITRADARIRMVNVERIPPHVNGKKYSMTLGIKAAKYDWLLLTDADCRPEGPNWISSMSSAFQENTQFVIGFSPYQKTVGFLNLFIRFETLLTALQYISFGLLKNPYMAVGRNMAYRKSFFLAEKGYNHFMNVTGGDDDLYVNQHATSENTRVILGRDATIHSIAETTWASFFRQKKRHLSVGKYYKFKHRFWLGLFLITWILSWWMLAPAALLSGMHYWVIGAMVLRIITLMLTFQTGLKRLDHKFELWMVPFLDFLFSIYYLTTGLVTLGTKKVRWKN
jgi:cellulose synthase/poly-beta-1,6-N-acetylglucosamine synthase-like glycosyltransferase